MRDILKLLTCTACTSAPHLVIAQEAATCPSCNARYEVANDVVYVHKPPSDVPVRGTLKLLRENWGEWREANFDHLVEELKGISHEVVILDLGAGKSPYWEYLNNSDFPNLLSIDFGLFEHIDATVDLTKRLPFSDGTFDVVVLSNVLEHIPEPVFAIAECHRILKAGGKLIGHTPFLLQLHDEPYDYYRYTSYALERLLTNATFRNVSVKPLASTDDVIRHIVSQYFSVILGNKKNALMIRFLRKIIFASFKIIARLVGPVRDRIQPKGYGWVGIKYK